MMMSAALVVAPSVSRMISTLEVQFWLKVARSGEILKEEANTDFGKTVRKTIPIISKLA